MLAISTAWRSRKSPSGKALIEEIGKLPTRAIELEFRIPLLMLAELCPLLAQGHYRVVSVHNYFPVPDLLLPSEGSGDAFLLSSDDEEERALAVKYSKRTLETAAELGAQCVVFHLGTIPLETTKRSLMRSLIEEVRSPNTRRTRDMVKGMREAHRKRYLANCMRSLGELIAHARTCGVTLCLENRYYPNEMPDLEEMDLLFEAFDGAPLAYWHDVGHAVVGERLGFDRADDLLKRNATRMAGIHLHDVRDFEDHLAPGLGEVDFQELFSKLPGGIIQVIEVHESTTAEELRRSFRFLSDIGFGNEGEGRR